MLYIVFDLLFYHWHFHALLSFYNFAMNIEICQWYTLKHGIWFCVGNSYIYMRNLISALFQNLHYSGVTWELRFFYQTLDCLFLNRMIKYAQLKPWLYHWPFVWGIHKWWVDFPAHRISSKRVLPCHEDIRLWGIDAIAITCNSKLSLILLHLSFWPWPSGQSRGQHEILDVAHHQNSLSVVTYIHRSSFFNTFFIKSLTLHNKNLCNKLSKIRVHNQEDYQLICNQEIIKWIVSLRSRTCTYWVSHGAFNF